ncbi:MULTISPECIES: hypothetical protein [Thermomonospora]|uniref:Uncharacterized protein n=1 Tax=Thermomonospora curvata (strain ATCC 19995 / DSM 43183 / JCM 3096 / KCTC 9072 / NBRC 15933 / NCIMB 10081 / Henssen B9) TaxID=471852 RepID=D1ADF9_THECD|nr:MULTISPECIES: hypothetical protein [Thermomonospora]ACY95669.1 hypothetical protein Tcur_0061 [Thermomonospora curvata DSM 43183]PKK16263.1 MAG: hypothetical protein BUE48_000300 [Thermomonospora sp. CIF 1]
MYGWIWRHLPGRGPVRALIAAGLVAVAVLLLWYVVFPWAESKVRFDENTVEGGSVGTPGPAPARTADER